MRRNFSIYLTILSACLLTGVLILLVGHHIPFVRSLNDWFFKSIAQSQSEQTILLDDYDGVSQKRHILSKVEGAYQAAPYTVVDFDLNSDVLGMNLPPHASDVALIMDELRTAGIPNIHLSIQFHREGSEGKLDSVVQSVLSDSNEPAFKNFLIPLEFTRAAKDTPFPSYLNSSSIELSKVSGDPNTIPVINKVIYPPFDGVNFKPEDVIPKSVKFGFASIESEELPEDKVLMLAQWEGRILFHQTLLSTMVLHEVNPEDVAIILGDVIDLGENKPKIPIDAFGAVLLEAREGNEQKPISVDYLIEKSDKEASLKGATDHALIVSTPTDEVSIQLVKNAYSTTEQLYQVPYFEPVAHYLRLPTWLEACILVEFTLICASLYGRKKWIRHLGYAILLLSLWPLSYFFQLQAGYWFPLVSAICLILIGWALTIYLSDKWTLRRQTSSLKTLEKKELTRFD